MRHRSFGKVVRKTNTSSKSTKGYELEVWKNYISNLEKFLDVEKNLMETRVRGSRTGEEYVAGILQDANRVYEAKKTAIGKEREIENEVYQACLEAINAEAAEEQ